MSDQAQITVEAVAPRAGSPWRRALERRSAADLPLGLALVMLLPFVVVTVILVFYPLVELVRVSLEDSGFDAWRSFFENDAYVRGLRITFTMAAVVTVICLICGSALAWMLKTTKRRWLRTLGLLLVIVPLWMGAVTQIYVIALVLAQRGPINQLLVTLGIVDEPLALMFTVGAVIVGMVFQMLPYATLAAYAAFDSVDERLVSVAENLGASKFRAFRTVVLPLASRGLTGAAALVFVISLGFFLTPVVLGSYASPFSATLIAQNIFVYYDVVPAAINGIVLVIGAFATMAIVGILLRLGSRRQAT